MQRLQTPLEFWLLLFLVTEWALSEYDHMLWPSFLLELQLTGADLDSQGIFLDGEYSSTSDIFNLQQYKKN